MRDKLIESFSASIEKMFIPKSPSEEERKDIEILHILKKNIDINDGEYFYKKSGFSIFLAPLSKILKGSIDNGFIEISTIASTLFEDSLDAFNIDFGNNSTSNDTYLTEYSTHVSKYFKPIIEMLRKHSLILYNHPAYIIDPSEILNIISVIPKDGDDIYENILSKETLDIINNEYDSLKEKIWDIVNRDDYVPSRPYTYQDKKLQLKTRIRKSRIYDEMTSYEGITKEMPDKVFKKTNKVFKSIPEKEKVFALHYLNHKLYHSLFQDRQKKKSSLFLSIPIIDPHPNRMGKKANYLGIGSVFIYLQLKEGFDALSLRQQIEEYALEIPKIIRSYLTGYTLQLGIDKYNIANEERKNAALQAKKAAISQVMARNMSHNIGSHVLSKYKDVLDIEKAFYTSAERNGQYRGYQNSSVLNPILHSKEVAAYFNEYLKNRMDFLADIATTDPVMETTMYLVKDLIRGFDKNRILLDRISGVSEQVRFGLTVIVEGDNEPINQLDNSHDPIVSIPNEVLGAQAFYILLENIIRNIYKHGNPTSDFDIIIEILTYKYNNSLFEVRIYDTLLRKKRSVEKIVKKRNNAFNDSILKEGKLRDNNLGTIEMDVCAAYLRCLTIISVDNDDYKLTNNHDQKEPNLIYAYEHEHKKEKEHTEAYYTLGYKFYIHKPKEVLVIDEIGTFKIEGYSNKELEAEGIKIIKPNELRQNSSYNHQIVYSLYPKKMLDLLLQKHRSQLSKRIIYHDKNVNVNSPKQFIDDLWKKYTISKHPEPTIYQIKDDCGKDIADISINSTIKYGADKTIQSKDNRIIISSHGKGYLANSGRDTYFEICCSHHKLYTLRNILPSNVRTTCEYIESVLLNTLIIDERIQENTLSREPYESDGELVIFKDYFRHQHILIPNKDEANLNVTSFGTLSKGDKAPITEADKISLFINKHINTASFCVVHLGILEKMLPQNTTKSSKAVGSIINQLFPGAKKRSKVIIISGRGKPDNLPNDIPFVSLALIQNAIETLFDKYLLTKILYNARRVSQSK